ncbi:hypothetical protein [Arcticibacter tournemirensis]|nr:hypothetical protein [Arcticibacter tournemirensis]
MKIAAAVFTRLKYDKDSIEVAGQISYQQVVKLWDTDYPCIFESIRTVQC